MLRKRSVSLSGHATSVALEAEFWAVLDAVAAELGLTHAGLMKRIDERRGRFEYIIKGNAVCIVTRTMVK